MTSLHSGFRALSTICLKKGSDVASASELSLGEGNVFHVTGTNDIYSISSSDTQEGRVIFLIFDDSLTVHDGNNLVLAGDFSTSANSVLLLVCDGTNWFEVSRSTN